MRNALLLIVSLSLFASCDDPGGKVIGIESTGVVAGVAYIDRNADGRLTLGLDATAGGVQTSLLLDATGDTIARATSDTDGTFRMDRVPVGRYRLVANRGSLGDTVQVLAIDSAQFSLAAGDTVVRLVPLGFPTITTAAVRTTPIGRRVMVQGIALNGWTTFADSTIHVADSTGALRAVRVLPSQIQAGDSVRLFGTTGTRDGHVVVADASAQVLGAAAGLQPPDSLGTGEAATAAAGIRADGQVRIAGALVIDTATVAGDLVMGVDDGSGRLEVVLDRNVTFNTGPYVPGATFRGAGVLVPRPAGGWQVKPRDRDEANITFATVPIAEARTLEIGRRVVVEGIALNGWAAFADSTVHVQDPTGAIRGVRVQGNVGAGDSVRLLGTLAMRDGQPVLTGASMTRLLAGVGVPAADSVQTADAATAQGGARDAGQVRIGGPITGSMNQANGDVILTVNDGSGAVEVLLDRDITFDAGPYQAGAIMRSSGVLVPTGTGTWRLKPRTRDDAHAFYPTVTVAEARALQVGQTVHVAGVALNGRNTFGDVIVHVQDSTGAVRFTNVPGSPSVLAGYTVKILGTVSVLNGMPALVASSIAEVSVGALPVPDSVSTQIAASADGGTRDAGQVALSGTVSDVQTVGSDVVLTVSDGSGPLEVVLDAQVGFPAAAYAVGDSIRARGVLVPIPAGTSWQLKPRSLTEVAKN